VIVHKKCGICNQSKEVSEFDNGHIDSCKSCSAKRSRSVKKDSSPQAAVPLTKKCTSCKTQKLLSAFPQKDDASDGRHELCEECIEKYWKEARTRNPICEDPCHHMTVYEEAELTDDALACPHTCDDDSLLQIIYLQAEHMLQHLHDKETPFEIDSIPDGFVDLLLMLAQHIVRLKEMRDHMFCEKHKR
jgi:hypothetical protein